MAEHTPEPLQPNHRTMLMVLMGVFLILWVFLPLAVPGSVQGIRLVTAPFRYLGVFVHEMGHGLFTLLSGGRFYWFQMDFNGGVAITSGGLSAATLLGGLLGPGLLGSWLLIASTRRRRLMPVFACLAILFAAGIYYMLKPLFLSPAAVPEVASWSITYLAALVVPVGAMASLALVRRASDNMQRFFLQVLGMLMCYSGFSDTRYILKYEPLNNGLFSDSRVLASLAWPGGPEALPWSVFVVVAVIVSAANIGLMTWGAYRALKA